MTKRIGSACPVDVEFPTWDLFRRTVHFYGIAIFRNARGERVTTRVTRARVSRRKIIPLEGEVVIGRSNELVRRELDSRCGLISYRGLFIGNNNSGDREKAIQRDKERLVSVHLYKAVNNFVKNKILYDNNKVIY